MTNPIDAFFSLSLSGAKRCWTRTLLSSSFEALAMSARLQQVLPSLVEAKAMSADSLIAFFLSRMLMFCFAEPNTWRPIIHFLRNCCLRTELGARILQRIRHSTGRLWWVQFSDILREICNGNCIFIFSSNYYSQLKRELHIIEIIIFFEKKQIYFPSKKERKNGKRFKVFPKEDDGMFKVNLCSWWI